MKSFPGVLKRVFPGTLASVVFINLKDWASGSGGSSSSNNIHENNSTSSSGSNSLVKGKDSGGNNEIGRDNSSGKLADRVATMLRAAHGFASSGSTRLLVLVVCPWPPSDGAPSAQAELSAAEQSIVESSRGCKRMHVLTSGAVMRYFAWRCGGGGGAGAQEEFWDAIGDRLGHVPFTDAAAVAMATCAIRIIYRF